MYRVVIIALGTLIGGLASAEPQADEVSPFIAAYKNRALQGDLSAVDSELSGLIRGGEDENHYRQFRARFVDRTDGLELGGVEDSLIEAAAVLFQDYWRDALLEPSGLADFEVQLSVDALSLLREHDLAGQDVHPDDALDSLKSAIEARGYSALFGRTRPLLEFMAWRKSESIQYQVELTDGTVPVTVHFLDDFISRGWLHFASFGEDATGGWANDDGLFAVDGYDRQSEKFLVSYLKHEARHFADYADFPKLRGTDLEYQAKLTELAFADQDMAHLLKKFTAQAGKDSRAPHPRANWQVINDLSVALLDGNWPRDANAWRERSNDAIRRDPRAGSRETQAPAAGTGRGGRQARRAGNLDQIRLSDGDDPLSAVKLTSAPAQRVYSVSATVPTLGGPVTEIFETAETAVAKADAQEIEAPVLVLFNEFDQFEARHGHALIVDLVNRLRPDTAKLVERRRIGHSDNAYATIEDAYAFENGTPAWEGAAQVMLAWLAGLEAAR